MHTNLRTSRGFTLVELIISLTVGLVVIAAAMSFAMTTFRAVGANDIRESVNRSARFVSSALDRDIKSTGVGIESLPDWGTMTVVNDSVVIFSVEFTPAASNVHPLVVAGPPPPAGQGTCGARCLDLGLDPDSTHDFQVGDLARLQVPGVRRLIIVENVGPGDPGTFRLYFSPVTKVLGYDAGLTGGLLLAPGNTMVQELAFAAYYTKSGQLWRAQQLNTDATLVESVIADNVQSWEVTVIFADGREMDQPNDTDADSDNDFDDIAGVRVYAVLAADNADPRVNNGVLYTRNYEWVFTPRNLVYERNR